MVRKAGTVILLLGVTATLYAACAFFLLQTLPPNDAMNGRLPSLYLLLIGMAVILLGTAIRGLRLGKTRALK